MPLVRVSRDKRGYEHTYLIQVPDGVRSEQARLLYWFRTPPGLKVGREPLDQAARRALETQYPDVTFDWRSLVATPPPVEQPNWRERRQAAKAAKRTRAGEDVAETAPDGSTPAAPPREGGRNRRKNRRGRGRRPDVAASSTDQVAEPEPAPGPGPADNPPDPS